MDLAKDLRAAQAAFETADKTLTTARATFDAAARTYDRARRYAPASRDTERARQEWALAGHEWLTALIARETAKDTAAAERRTTDRAAADALHLPTERSTR